MAKKNASPETGQALEKMARLAELWKQGWLARDIQAELDNNRPWSLLEKALVKGGGVTL